jgi:uncharacterized protein
MSVMDTHTTDGAPAPDVQPAPSVSRVGRVLTAPIHWYQHARAGRLSPCRFHPGCSSYALEAIEVHGSFRGSWLALRRLSRCRPLGGHGYDPVPPRRMS